MRNEIKMAGTMRSGFGEIQKTVERQKAGFTPPTGKLNYFSLEAGEVIFVRFLDDVPVTAKFYEFILNNQGKTVGAGTEFICAPDLYQYDEEWKANPDNKDWVLKWQSSTTPGIGWCKKWKSDELVLPKLMDRTVGIAVQVEPDVDSAGNVIPGQYRDVLEQIEVDNEQVISLHFMIVRQALSNFWDQMVGYHGLYGTICDRPYRIERKGGDLKTNYQAIGMNPDPNWNYDGSSLRALQAIYGYGVKLSQEKDDKGTVTSVSVELPDLPEDQLAAYQDQTYTWDNRHLYCPTTVKDWCARRASEDYADYWLNPNAEHLKDKPKQGVTADQLLNTQRPVDPRQQTAAAPPPAAAPDTVAVVSTATGEPVVHQQAVPAPPESNGIDEFHKDTTQNPNPVPAPAAPISGDRFEEMRAEMAKRASASK